MIFVTVGTHEQPFNRLVICIDKWAEEHKEKVIVQTGFSSYVPKNCEWQKFYSYQEIVQLVKKARIVITHGGPSSFILPLQVGKIPIVVPRKYEFNEHVNNHQVSFAKNVEKRMGIIKVVEKMDDLVKIINNYDDAVRGINKDLNSNNAKFCNELGRIVEEMFEFD